MSRRAVLLSGLFAFVLFGGARAQAAPILGAQLFYTGGDVTVGSLPVTSGYTSELGLYSPTFDRLVFLLNDEPPGVSATFDPAAYGIAIGQELIFGIRVLNTGDEFFMGPAGRNPDNFLHAGVDNLGSGVYVVGFEDLFGGGDQDYDDNRFQFTGAITQPVPEPATLTLLGLSLVGLAARRRQRRS